MRIPRLAAQKGEHYSHTILSLFLFLRGLTLLLFLLGCRGI